MDKARPRMTDWAMHDAVTDLRWSVRQHGDQAPEELCEVNGLREECRQAKTMHFFFTPFYIETAHHDNRCVGLDVSKLFDKFKSGDAGHDKVHDQGIVVSRMSQD
jgi:hypothetical protein